jgi:hypothetical protein
LKTDDRAPLCTAETDFVHYMALYVRYSLSCSSDFCTLYVSTSTKNPKNFKKSKFFQKSYFPKMPKKPKYAKIAKKKKSKKSKKTASSAASAAFATSTAYLVCLIVLKNKAKNQS